MSESAAPDAAELVRRGEIPLHACLVGLTWVIHDYVITLEDEIRHIWPQRINFGKIMFLWIRYYSIFALIFDVTQMHTFSIPGVPNELRCVAIDAVIRLVGAMSLWSVQVVMQARVYALYGCSRRVLAFNDILFLFSFVAFLYILICNTLKRREAEWAQWIPATGFEFVLFGFALFKSFQTAAKQPSKLYLRNIFPSVQNLFQLLIRDNILYFIGITTMLVINNLMVVGGTKIPWFSYSPFHASMAVLTTRMLLNLRKASASLNFIASVGGRQVKTESQTHITTVQLDDTNLSDDSMHFRTRNELDMSPSLGAHWEIWQTPSPESNAAIEMHTAKGPVASSSKLRYV